MPIHKVCGREFEDRAALAKHLFSKECTGIEDKAVEVTDGYLQVEGEIMEVESVTEADSGATVYLVGGKLVKGADEAITGATNVMPVEQAAAAVPVVDIFPAGEFGADCVCRGYEGQGWNCPRHGAKQECPRCRCIDTELPETRYEDWQEYRCGLCSAHYRRNLTTGEYGFP